MSVGGRTHIPVLDADRCERCGGCSWQCPAAVFPEITGERDSLRGALFSTRPYPGTPGELPPCRLACPLMQDVPAYISAIARGDVDEAAAVIRKTNALPSVCGRICIAACSRACTREAIDEGLDIRRLKRFATEAARASEPEPFPLEPSAHVVAVVGAGPAGLAGAHRLGQLGIRPVVLEATGEAGGMLADVIPAFVLPREALAADIRALQKQGVTIRTSVRIGRDLSWDQIESEHDAILVTTGAGAGTIPAIPGNELEGVSHVIDFCRTREAMTGPVVIEGGGLPALHAARLARRLGAKVVHVVHTVPLERWSVGARALEIAKDEGIDVHPGLRVIELTGSGGKLEQVVTREICFAGVDGVGRSREVLADDTGAEQRLLASRCVFSIYRGMQPEARPDLDGIATGVLGNLQVDDSYRLSRRGWYAAGEAATGAATLIDSMASGRLAAESIARDLAARGERG